MLVEGMGARWEGCVFGREWGGTGFQVSDGGTGQEGRRWREYVVGAVDEDDDKDVVVGYEGCHGGHRATRNTDDEIC